MEIMTIVFMPRKKILKTEKIEGHDPVDLVWNPPFLYPGYVHT